MSAMVAMRAIVMVTTLMTNADDHDEFDDDDAGDYGGDHSGDRCRYEDDERDDDERVHGPTMQESDLHRNLPSAEERWRGRPAHGEWHPPRVGAGKAWRNRSSAPANGRPADASGEAGSDSKRLTLRWRCSDQYLLRSLGDPARMVRSGALATLADGAACFELAEPALPPCASDCFC